MMTSFFDTVVLDACRVILESAEANASVLARELLPRIARARGSDRFVQSLRWESVGWLKERYGNTDVAEWSFRWQVRRRALDRLAELDTGGTRLVELAAPQFRSCVAITREANELRMTVAEVAISAAAHMREHGAWPKQLTDIVPPDSEERVRAAAITWSFHGDEARLVAALDPNSNYLGEWTLR